MKNLNIDLKKIDFYLLFTTFLGQLIIYYF